MPLMVDDQSMMNDTMTDIDDLFGDGDNEGLNAALAATLDSDLLRQRVEEAHIVGCCRKLAWSRAGSIAHITPDARRIAFRVLVRDKKTAKWSLSPENNHSIAIKSDSAYVHLEWSASGSELVAIDQFGRIEIYAQSFALNRLLPNRLNYTVPNDDLSAVVGLHWLSLNMGPQRVPIVSPATKEGERWVTGMQPYQYQSASHPIDGRSAFLCVTRSNQLKLFAQQTNAPWTEAVSELGELTSSSDIITHASFGDIQGQILLATYDASKSLRLYRVHILWNPTQGDVQHGQPPTVSPVLRVTHVQLLDRTIPQNPNGAELSQILIQPPTVGVEKGSVTLTALFTCLPDDQQMGHQASGRGSIIARWELRPSEVVLHEVFKTLKPGTDKLLASKARETLHRLPDTQTSKIYLSMSDNLYHNTLACASSDGTIDFRARDTMDPILADGNSSHITSLQQAGFVFMPSECADISLSPSGCIAAVTRQDGSVELHMAEYVHGWADAKADHYLPQAAIVALARETGILICHTFGTDDILALIPTDLDVGLRRRFIAELLRTVSKNTDFSGEDAAKDKMRVMKDSLFFKVVSMQFVLGYETDPRKHDIPSKIAWALLQLRSLSSNLGSAMQMNMSQHTTDVLISLHSQTKYLFDLFHLVLDHLFAISRSLSDSSTPLSRASILQNLAETNSPALHLLLQSAPRHLLRFLTEITKHFLQRCIAAKPQAVSPVQRLGLQEIENLVQTYLAFKLPVFEQLLGEIDQCVRRVYAEQGIEGRERSQIEQSMLVEGAVPEKLMGVVEMLFKEGGIVSKLKGRVDGVKVFFCDYEWLGYGDAGGSNKEKEDKWRTDVVRKIRMGRERRVRTCRRCGSVVEDIVDVRGAGGLPWILGAMRACVCVSAWVV